MNRSRVYYNDSEPFVCDWLENLMRAGLLPSGEVDRRPIQEVQPDDVRSFTQCHFFAGIGGWPYALRLGGWPAARPVWTGSCPCQDLSAAGKQRGAEGDRHLWPEWYRLITECRPPTVFGEQVASKLGRYWLTAVRLDLEELGYAVGAADLCAAGVGAPHIRQRLWFVADAEHAERRTEQQEYGDAYRRDGPGRSGVVGGVADAAGSGRAARIADTEARQPDSPWSSVDWLPCRDGKARSVEPGTFPLAHGLPARVGRLRAYGNAINPYTAAAFVRAYMEAVSGGAGGGAPQ